MSESKCLFFFRSASFGAGSVLALSVIAILFSVLSSAQRRQQSGDGRPRVFFESGPPSELFSESDLQQQSNSFSESFPSYCPGAVVTRERSKADFVVRLGLSGDAENQTLSCTMAIFQREG